MAAESLESLVARLQPQLRRLASRSTCLEVAQDADDLLHDLYVSLAEHQSVPAGYTAEVHAVMRFKTLIAGRERSCRRRRRRERAVGIVSADRRQICNGPALGGVGVMRTRPEEVSDSAEMKAVRHEMRWHIKRAVRLAGLRANHRCALRAWLRDSLDDFARRRGISRSTARVWALRARRAMRPYLEHLAIS